ncbi:T9SS type A sorting domain-containing protein [Segetibacter koreensis]|uniref:T9SS type A sorting domain-containing protein n=1 Tax=Segetibacter koreensis TaxID=398037 RepID=UPI00037AF937|nr:T9SS type A sorting domain-containing protein [Segetibacter koreensis]
MKQRILPYLAIAAVLISSHSIAQKNTAFAVTGESKGNFTWNVIREIDLATGEVIRTVYDPSVKKSVNYKLTSGLNKGNSFLSSATGSGVAAAAFDALHNRLYFTCMRSNTLMYFDLGSSDLNVVIDDNPAFNTGNKVDEANIITRMAFASDGVGYAITNDGKSLIRFTTDQKPSVTNLSELIDGKKNGTMSIHAQCSSWGGDMVGDAYGNMYLVTYRNHIFKLNPKTRIADYLGQLKGVPPEFTSNGMVVNNNGELIVSSATLSNNYYKVNISTLEATAINKNENEVYNSSDLANSNLLYQKKGDADKIVWSEVKGNEAVSVYPNPTTNRTFTVKFDKVPAGRYNLVLTDASGRNVITKPLNIALPGQTEKVSLPRTSAGGMYLIKLTGGNKKVFYNDKLIVQ